jgi:hypothetical protein
MMVKLKIVFLFLLPTTIADAKCNCVRPHLVRPMHPSDPIPPAPQPIQDLEQYLPIPVPNLPVTPVQPVPQVPTIEPEPSLEEMEEPAPPETISKDEARKVALVLSGMVATVVVFGAALFTKLNRRVSVQENARLLGFTAAIERLQARVGNLHIQVAQNATAIEEILRNRGGSSSNS